MRTILALAAIVVSVVTTAHADKFVNTGPGTIHTCDTTSRVRVGIPVSESIDNLSGLALGSNSSLGSTLGARMQLNKVAGNGNAKAVFFENYVHSGPHPVLRVLTGENTGASLEISSWNLSSHQFWTRGGMYAWGEIVSDVGFRVGGTALNVPDYVFKSDYQLRSLEETESFIQKNKHLPDVPSASEVRRDGMSLTEMNMVLLRKVEELTLYAIEQEKRIQKLEAQGIALQRTRH